MIRNTWQPGPKIDQQAAFNRAQIEGWVYEIGAFLSIKSARRVHFCELLV